MSGITFSDSDDDREAPLPVIRSSPLKDPHGRRSPLFSIARSSASDSDPCTESDVSAASATHSDSPTVCAIEDSFELDAEIEASDFYIGDAVPPGAAAAPPPPSKTGGPDSGYRSCFCRRFRRPQFRAPLLFTWSIDGRNTYCAKTRQVQSNTTYINEGSEVHIKAQQYQWILRSSNHFCTFELTKRDAAASEMRVFITNDYGKEIGPRKFRIEIGNSVTLLNRIPRRKANGSWSLNFNGKYVVKSQKNAIIIDEGNHPVIIIRKIEKTTLQIETIRGYSDVQLFTLGVISFLCPV